jgi:hypothetical protein
MPSARGHIRIPDEIVARPDLTPTHKLLLGVLGRLQGYSQSCSPSIGYLVKATGLSERHVQYLLRDLAKLSEISVASRPHQTNIYVIAWTAYRNLRKKWAAERSRGRVQNLARRGARIAPN